MTNLIPAESPACASCQHSRKRLSFLGWRLRCTRFKIPVVSAKPCIDWRLSEKGREK